MQDGESSPDSVQKKTAPTDGAVLQDQSLFQEQYLGSGACESIGNRVEDYLELSGHSGQDSDYNDRDKRQDQAVFHEGLAFFAFEMGHATHQFGIDFSHHMQFPF